MQEAVASLPDQIDEAIKYITSLEANLKKSKEKKESLIGRKKRPHTCTNFEETVGLKSPKLEIRETGSALQIVLITGLDNQFIFNEMIHILHGEQAEVLNASFSTSGDSVLHLVHAEVFYKK